MFISLNQERKHSPWEKAGQKVGRFSPSCFFQNFLGSTMGVESVIFFFFFLSHYPMSTTTRMTYAFNKHLPSICSVPGDVTHLGHIQMH